MHSCDDFVLSSFCKKMPINFFVSLSAVKLCAAKDWQDVTMISINFRERRLQ